MTTTCDFAEAHHPGFPCAHPDFDRILLLDGMQDRASVLDVRIVDYAQSAHRFVVSDEDLPLLHRAKADATESVSGLTADERQALTELADEAVEWLNRQWGRVYFVEDSCLWSERDEAA